MDGLSVELDISKVRIWYDRKRGCYVSNVGMVLSPQLGLPPAVIAAYFCRCIEERYPGMFESWVS